jgi:outer membrane beta-barrel protein
MFRRSATIIATALVLGSFSTVAQGQDDLDDILNEDDTQPRTAGEERAALIREADAKPAPVSKADKNKRVIQTMQHKNFMKIGRYEGTIQLGFVANDPFINRYLVSGKLGYHVTEIFGVEGNFAFSPDFGDGDLKPITRQINLENQVTPDISKLQFYTDINFEFSPIYGKVALLGRSIINFDLYGVFGTGIVRTVDDLEALGAETDERAATSASQIHPTIGYGGGLRVIFTPAFAMRVEGRGLSYVEVLESTTLEMKNYMTLLVGVSFFFPGMK